MGYARINGHVVQLNGQNVKYAFRNMGGGTPGGIADVSASAAEKVSSTLQVLTFGGYRHECKVS